MLFTASPLSQTVTPSRTSSPLERDVLYGRPLICATYMYMYIDEVLHLYQHIRCEILLLFTRFQLGLASKYLTHLKRKHVLHHFVCSGRLVHFPFEPRTLCANVGRLLLWVHLRGTTFPSTMT